MSAEHDVMAMGGGGDQKAGELVTPTRPVNISPSDAPSGRTKSPTEKQERTRMATIQHVCAACGVKLEPASGAPGRPRKFCSTCRPTGPIQRVEPRPCAYCGETFAPSTRRAKYCSSTCKYRARDGVIAAGTTVETACAECGQGFAYRYLGLGAHRKVCSDKCRAARARRSLDATHAQQATGRLRACIVCLRPIAERRRTKTCSIACAEILHRQTRTASRRARNEAK